jgi:hypothetical protein
MMEKHYQEKLKMDPNFILNSKVIFEWKTITIVAAAVFVHSYVQLGLKTKTSCSPHGDEQKPFKVEQQQ